MSFLRFDAPPQSPDRLADSGTAAPGKMMTRNECEALFHKIVGMMPGGGDTSVMIHMSSQEYINWSRNRPTIVGVTREHRVVILRTKEFAGAMGTASGFDDASLKAAVAQVDSSLQADYAQKQAAKEEGWRTPIILPDAQQYVVTPPLWSDTTARVTEQGLSDTVRHGVDAVRSAQCMASGHASTRTVTWSVFNTRGLAAYAAGTGGIFTQTVRAPDGTASGWAGGTHTDWAALDVDRLSTIALEKCTKSLNPRAVEPGRYTTILEPQAAGSVINYAVQGALLEAAGFDGHAYHSEYGLCKSKLGRRVMDERLTITSDPADPDGPIIPFTGVTGRAYRPVTWIERGVLTALAYEPGDRAECLRQNPNDPRARTYLSAKAVLHPNSYRVSTTGEQTSLEEMIATTERGLLVTRFGDINPEDSQSLLTSTVTRDGFWLIERGKIKFPVKNMRVLDSPMFFCNNILQVGKPERTFGVQYGKTINPFSGPSQNLEDITALAFGRIPIVAPALKVRDFNFVALADAV